MLVIHQDDHNGKDEEILKQISHMDPFAGVFDPFFDHAGSMYLEGNLSLRNQMLFANGSL